MEFVSYLFSPIPGPSFGYTLHISIYVIILLIAGIGLRILIKLKKENKALRKTWRSAPSEFIWIALIITILTASRVKSIPYLSMRFLLFLSLLISLYFVVKNIYKYFKKYPEMKKITAPKTHREKEKKIYTTKK